MKNRLMTAAIVAALASAASVNVSAAAKGASPSELEQLKTQLQALQQKVEELERAQSAAAQSAQAASDSAKAASTSANAANENAKKATDTAEHATDVIAQVRSNVGDWVGRFQWKGDFRYRFEDIKQEGTKERERDRMRLRAGFFAKVNDTVRTEVQLSTSEALSSGGYGDARSSNQTLTDASSRKRIWLDTAYAEWAPNANWKVTGGKMRYPWVRANNSGFFDADINPEGVAVNWQQGTDGVFASAFYIDLAERSTMADSTLSGAQVGWRGNLGSSTRLLVAAGYFDHGAVEGYNAVQDGVLPGNAFGNTTTNNPAICRPGVLSTPPATTTTACIADDFNVAELLAELTVQVAGRPLIFSADYARNNKADFSSATVPADLDTAYAAGIQYGKVSAVNSWEVSWTYQKIENDALYGQWVDSDFGGGSTGVKGSALRFGYGLGKNWRVNGTYFLNDTNIDLPATVGGVPITDRKYDRWQLDMNFVF